MYLYMKHTHTHVCRQEDGNVAAVSHGQHVPTPTAAAVWHANMAVSKVAWCDVGYLWASFSLPRPLCYRLRPMYATDVRQHHRIMPPPIRGGGIIMNT